MGRSRKCRGGAGSNDNNIQNTELTENQRQQNLPRPIPSAQQYEPPPFPSISGPIPSAPPLDPIPSAPPYEPPFASISGPIPSAPPLDPIPSAPPYEPPFASISGPSLSPEAIIEREKPTCGSFTARIPGIRSTSTLTWAQLRDLCTTQLTPEEDASVSDPHEYFRSLVGADGSLLAALRGAVTDVLPVDRTNEIQGLLSGWMEVREGLGLPPIRDPYGDVITVERLNPLSCRITADRHDLAEYSNKWNVVASFVEARPPIFKAVFAEVFIPTTITGGSEGGMACLEGFCDYAFIEMKKSITKCFAREHRALPTVLPPMTGVLKMRRGRTTVSAFLESVTPIPGEESIVLESHRDRIMGILQRTYPGVDWTRDDITTIFNELRTVYSESYRGGKTRRKRKRRTRRSRFQLKKL